VGSVALGLANLIRDLETGLLLSLTGAGLLLGWALGRSALPGWLGGLVALTIGAEVIIVHLGRLSQPLTALVRSLAKLAWEMLHQPLEGVPEGIPIATSLTELETRFSALLNRVRDWGTAVARSEAGFDPLATALVWSLAMWITAVWAGWAVRRRHRPLQAIAPAGALLVTALSYTWADPDLLAVLLGSTLLLMVLTRHVARERRWQAVGIDFSPELRLDLAMVTIPLSVVIVLVAIFTPSLSVRPLVSSVERLLVEHLSAGKQIADSMGLEPLAGSGIALAQARAAGLPNQSLIGSGPELSDEIVMFVFPEGLMPVSEPASLPDPPLRLYWRALTYDKYTGRGWQTGETETVTYKAGEPIVLGDLLRDSTAHQTQRQEVRAVGDLGGLLYRAGELVTADHDFRVAWRDADDAFGAEIDAQVYKADSLLPVVSQKQLRATSDDYPEQIRAHYLSLPPEVPERVWALALDLTTGKATSYDQALAIESFLRGFPYTLDLPAPPPNREIADYFLFDLQQGYCDYYATTMVVLARAAGLPARLVTGYVNGTYDATRARYIVTEADAHSWVEIYFPDYGWIEFEPTGGRPPLERPAETTSTGISEPQTPLEPKTVDQFDFNLVLWLGSLGVLTLVGLGGAVWWFGDGWRLRHLGPAEAVATLYQRLWRHGRRLAVSAEEGATPHEFADDLANRVIALAQERSWNETSGATVQEIRWLTDLHIQGQYSQRKPAAADRSRAIKMWRRLRPKLWLAWVWRITQRGDGPRPAS
jgi:transglutaminase-like putative cysteine protease